MNKIVHYFLLKVIVTLQLTKSHPIEEPSSCNHYPCSVSCGGGVMKVEKMCEPGSTCNSQTKTIECNVEPCKQDGR